MKLQSKVALIIAGAWLAICVIIYADSKWVITANYQQVEQSMAQMEVRDVQRAYAHSMLALQMYSTAWAVWDEAYAFMEKKDSKFIAQNFVPGTFTSSHLNFFMFYENSGKLYHGKFFDLQNNRMTDVPESTLSYLEDNKNFIKHDDHTSKKIGVLNTKDGLVVMSSLPVISGAGNGPVHGTLLMGYYLNDQYFKDLADTVGLDLNFYPISAVKNDKKLNAIFDALLVNPTENIKVLNDNIIRDYILLHDIASNPVGLIQINIPRIVYQQGLSTSYHYFFIVMILGLFVILLTWFLLKRFVLNRVFCISKQVQKISREGKFDKRIKFQGTDELASMVYSINSMMQLINNSQDQLTYLATHDSLTTLPNRELFYDLLSQALITAHHNNQKIAVFFLDMDKFKQVNDQYGHYVGDRLLQLIAKRIKHSIRATDVAARQSGDEFILFFRNIKDIAHSNEFAENLLNIGKKPFVIGEHEIKATFSIGISIYPNDATDIENLLRHADDAMYEAKNQAGNSYRIYGHKTADV